MSDNNPHKPAIAQGYTVTQGGEGDWQLRITTTDSGPWLVMGGLASEAEGRELGDAVLNILAKRRDVQPTRIADRTPERLMEALRRT